MLSKFKALFANPNGEPVPINELDDAVAQKMGLKLGEGSYKTAEVNEETGEVVFTSVSSPTPPAFSSDRFLVNPMASFANAKGVELPLWTHEPFKIATAIANWEQQA